MLVNINDNYETAIRNVKASLFDVVASQELELSSIEAMIASGEGDTSKLQELYEKENEALRKVIDITSKLNLSLLELESYSRNLKELKNGNIADMVDSIDDSKINRAYSKDLMNGETAVNEVANDMIDTISSNSLYDNQKDDLINDIKTIQQGPEDDSNKEDEVEYTHEVVDTDVPDTNILPSGSIADALSNLSMKKVFNPVEEVAENSEDVSEEVNEDNSSSDVETSQNELVTDENINNDNALSSVDEDTSSEEVTNVTPEVESPSEVASTDTQEAVSNEVVIPGVDGTSEVASTDTQEAVSNEVVIPGVDGTSEVTSTDTQEAVSNEVVIPGVDGTSEVASTDTQEAVSNEVVIPGVDGTSEVTSTDTQEAVSNELVIPGVDGTSEVASTDTQEAVSNEVVIPGVDGTSEVASTDTQEAVSNEVVIPGVDGTSEVASTDTQEAISNEVVIPGIDGTSEVAPTDTQEAVSNEAVSNEAVIPVTENADDISTTVEVPITASIPVTEVDEASNIVLPSNTDSSNDPILPTIDLPVVNNTSADTTTQSTDTLSDLQQTVDNSQNLINENKEMAMANGTILQKLVFFKNNAGVAKAILTTSNQIAKLRSSRESQKALVNLIDSTANNDLASNTLTAANDELVSQQNMEQALINKGLLEPDTIDTQKKIEDMLVQANNLYKAGNVAEAQSMYEQISELNKQLQQNTVSKAM
jgi:hypothetical protein